MTDQTGFRIGDVATGTSHHREQGSAGGGAGLDADAFPTLVQCLRLPPNDFRERLDFLAGRTRQESSPAVQRALSLAAQMLPILYKNYGGQS